MEGRARVGRLLRSLVLRGAALALVASAGLGLGSHRDSPIATLASSQPTTPLSRIKLTPNTPPPIDDAPADPAATAYPQPLSYDYPHAVLTAQEAAQLRAAAEAYIREQTRVYLEERARIEEEARLRAQEEARRAAAAAYARELAAAVPPPGVAYGPNERWIAVDLARQRAIAFEGGTPVHVALVTTGADGWETPRGDFRIYSRIENETMDSLSIGIPRDDPWGYYLENVYYTQYFVGGVALHYNYWRPDSYFGNVRSSHGCVGMRYDDALFFWNFATIGTRVVVF